MTMTTSTSTSATLPNSVFNMLWEKIARGDVLQLYVPVDYIERMKKGISRAKARSNKRMKEDRENSKLSFSVDQPAPGTAGLNTKLLTCWLEPVVETSEEDALALLANIGVVIRNVASSQLTQEDQLIEGEIDYTSFVPDDEFLDEDTYNRRYHKQGSRASTPGTDNDDEPDV